MAGQRRRKTYPFPLPHSYYATQQNATEPVISKNRRRINAAAAASTAPRQRDGSRPTSRNSPSASTLVKASSTV